MSLKSFVKMADVKAKLKPLRPGPPRKIPAALAAEPRSKRYTVVGTAFDYLLRFSSSDERRTPWREAGWLNRHPTLSGSGNRGGPPS